MNNSNTLFVKIQEKFLHNFDDLQFFSAFRKLNLKSIAQSSNIKKEQGIEAFDILTVMILLSFIGKTVHHFTQHCKNSFFQIAKKDTFYRFSENPKINWRRFLFNISLKIISDLKKYVSFENSVLVIDDTTIIKTGKKIEELSWVYDHTLGKPVKGFHALVLGFCDGNSIIPVDFSIHGGSKKVSDSVVSTKIDMRTSAGIRRKEINKKRTDVACEMLQRAYNKGVEAKYVLFDSWFCYPSIVKKIYNDIGFEIVSRIKDSSRIMVKYNNKVFSTKNFCNKILSRSRRSVICMNKEKLIVSEAKCTFGDIDIKILLCKPEKENTQKKSVILMSTNTDLSAEEIISIYTKRWSIETMFKENKQKLLLGKQHSRKFEANICFITLSLVRYAIMAYVEREKNDYRTIGSLFENVKYEIEKLNSIAYFQKLFAELLDEIDIKCQYGKKILLQITQVFDNIAIALDNLIFQGCET